MLEAEAPGEGAFECAICHEEIASQDESFLDGCFHPFCLQCILQWTQVQAKHPRKDGSMRVYECPLCKTPYRSVLHDHNREQGTFRRTWNPGESGDHLISPAVLTRGHGRRRATYFQPAEVRQGIRAHIAELRRGKPHVAAHRHDSVEVQKWLTRELQALLLDKDVRFVQETVNGGINQAAVAIGGKHRGHNRSSIAFAEEVRARLLREDTLQKLLGEHSEWFVEELLAFVATGLTCAANDRLLDEAMTLVVQPSSRPSLEGEAGSSEDTTAAEKRVRGAAEVAAGQEVEGGMAKGAGGAGGEGSGGPIQLGKEQACGSAAQQLPIAAVENHAGSTGLAPLQEALALTPRAEDMSAWDLELEVSRIGALIAKHRAELMGLKAQWSDEGSK